MKRTGSARVVALYDLPQEVQHQWERYQQDRSLERFLRLREAVAASAAYDPDSPSLKELSDSDLHLTQGSLSEGLSVLQALMSNWLLTPRIHMMAAHLFDKAQQKSSADREMYLGDAVRDGLLQTGTGSELYPYRILHALDAREVLMQLDKMVIGHHHAERDGKPMLLCDCADATTVWFEMPAPWAPKPVAPVPLAREA